MTPLPTSEHDEVRAAAQIGVSRDLLIATL